MKRQVVWTLCFTLSLVLAPTLFGTDGLVKEVPFQLRSGYLILVRGSIGPAEDLTFLIDTGARSTFVSRELADELHLSRRMVGGAEILVLRDLAIGSVPFHTVPVGVRDLSFLFDFAGEIDAIIGLTVLRRQNFSIDYESRTLAFGTVPQFDSGTSLETAHFLVSHLVVSGQPLRLIVDTGAGEVYLSRKRLLSLGTVRRNHKSKEITHLGNAELAEGIELQDVDIGDMQWRRLIAFAISDPVSGHAKIDGLLGVVSLNFARISFDFESQLMTWEK